MTSSPAARLAVALIFALGATSLLFASEAAAQETLPSEPTQPTDPIDSIGPAPNSPSHFATTTRVPTEHLDAAHLQQSLHRQGYYDIHGIQRDGSRYRAMAQKDGRPVELEIDVRTGTVTPKRM